MPPNVAVAIELSEQERLQLRGLLLAGASSAPTKPVDGAYFDGLRKKVRAIKPGARR